MDRNERAIVPLGRIPLPQLFHVAGRGQLNGRDTCVHRRQHRRQQQVKLRDQPCNRRRVEQRCGIFKRPAVTPVHLVKNQGEIKLRDGGFDRVGFPPHTGQIKRGDRKVLQCEQHLEHRMAVEPPRRPHGIHHKLKRHFLVIERITRRRPGSRQQVGKRRRAFQIETQHERVDEQADQVVCAGHRTPCHRRADDDVVLAAPAVQQRRKRREQHHVRRGIGLSRDRLDLRTNVRTDLPAE